MAVVIPNRFVYILFWYRASRICLGLSTVYLLWVGYECLTGSCLILVTFQRRSINNRIERKTRDMLINSSTFKTTFNTLLKMYFSSKDRSAYHHQTKKLVETLWDNLAWEVAGIRVWWRYLIHLKIALYQFSYQSNYKADNSEPNNTSWAFFMADDLNAVF